MAKNKQPCNENFICDTIKETKTFLICPVCLERGKREVLGVLDVRGNLIIKRHGNSDTKVVSEEMIVFCGSCGEEIFYRRKQ